MLLCSGGLTAVLFAANKLPNMIQGELAGKYEDLDQATKSTGLDSAIVPAYFPEGISWPPSFIFAQKRPFSALVTEFRDKVSGKTSLIVIQTSQQEEAEKLQRIHLIRIDQQTPYSLKGRNAVLQVGLCDNETTCSRIAWRQDGENYFSVLLMSGPFELIRIAESMIR